MVTTTRVNLGIEPEKGAVLYEYGCHCIVGFGGRICHRPWLEGGHSISLELSFCCCIVGLGLGALVRDRLGRHGTWHQHCTEPFCFPSVGILSYINAFLGAAGGIIRCW